MANVNLESILMMLVRNYRFEAVNSDSLVVDSAITLTVHNLLLRATRRTE